MNNTETSLNRRTILACLDRGEDTKGAAQIRNDERLGHQIHIYMEMNQ